MHLSAHFNLTWLYSENNDVMWEFNATQKQGLYCVLNAFKSHSSPEIA